MTGFKNMMTLEAQIENLLPVLFRVSGSKGVVDAAQFAAICLMDLLDLQTEGCVEDDEGRCVGKPLLPKLRTSNDKRARTVRRDAA